MSFSLPSSSRTVAPKSIRNTESVSRFSSLYSWGRTSTDTTSTFNRAERMVLAMRSSSIRYLNTMSYIGLATIIVLEFYCSRCKSKDYFFYAQLFSTLFCIKSTIADSSQICAICSAVRSQMSAISSMEYPLDFILRAASIAFCRAPSALPSANPSSRAVESTSF